LGGVEGTFVLPDPLPRQLLFISAGSGITPIMSMLRSIAHAGKLDDVVHLHSARTEAEVIFGRELRELAAAHPGYRLHERLTGAQGRLIPGQLDECCPDWCARETFLCGPPGLLEALGERWQRDGDPAKLHVEHFQPDSTVGDGERGEGGTISFCSSDLQATSDGEQPILVAGENPMAVAWASATPAWGGCVPAGSAICVPAASTASPAKCCVRASTRPRARSRSSSSNFKR
jgi:ferredoxin-NADP reductase